MKRLLFLLSMLLPTSFLVHAAILNNSGTSSEDSLSVYVSSLDSLGNPTAADSFFVVVLKSGTNAVAFSDSGIASTMVGLDTVAAGAGITHYYYHRAVADIDGLGATGQYSGAVVAKTNSPALLTPNEFSFQITGWELDQMGDSSGIAAVQSLAAIDSLAKIIDSLQATLDTLQNQDNWIGNVRYSYIDSTLNLAGLHVRATGQDTAVVFDGAGRGMGLWASSDSGDAALLVGGPSASIGESGTYGQALRLLSTQTAALFLSGYVDGMVINATSLGGDAIALNGGQWNGSNGSAIKINGSGTNSLGILVYGVNDSGIVATLAIDSATGTLIANLARNAALAGDTSAAGPWVNLADIQAIADTTRSLTGYGFGAWAKNNEYTDLDTMFVGNNLDTLLIVISYHTGGGPGTAPDSSKAIRW